MDYSTIWDTKTVASIGGITSAGTSTSNHSWDPYNFRVSGNRIVVEGGNVESVETDSLSDIIRIKVTPTIKFAYGQTGACLFDPPKVVTFDYTRNRDKFGIKKIQINPKKMATTVIFEDGKVVVVKKHDGDPEVDILSVVSYAIAEKVYGSNSAFKRQLKNCAIEVLSDDKEKLEAECVL